MHSTRCSLLLHITMVCLCVCLLIISVNPTKMAKPIDMPFEIANAHGQCSQPYLQEAALIQPIATSTIAICSLFSSKITKKHTHMAIKKKCC